MAMKSFNKIFFRGLITLLPVTITIYVAYSAVVILEGLLGELLKQILPGYVPGLGLFLMFVLIFVFGLLLNNFLAARIMGAFEKKMTSLPLIKAIYSPLKDLVNLFNRSNDQGLNHVVLVELGDSKAQVMGLMTRENFDDLQLGDVVKDKVAVYFPLSYGLGGYTVLVPKNQVNRIDLPVEKAMSLAITGWVKTASAPQADKEK